LAARDEASKPKAPQVGRSVEWSLVVTVVSFPELFGVLRRDLSLEDFEEDRCRSLLEVLEALDHEGRVGFPMEEILTRLGDEALGSELVRDVMSGEYQTNGAELLRGGVQKMKEKTLLVQRRKVLARLEKATDEGEKTRLLQEYKFLKEESTRLKGND
jgi:hypothetical protein